MILRYANGLDIPDYIVDDPAMQRIRQIGTDMTLM